MPKYIFTYQVPLGFVPGSDPKATAAWEGFFNDIASSIVDPGQPVAELTSIGEVGASTRLGGYSVVDASSLEDAAGLAKGCPVVAAGGGVQVAQLADLPPDHVAARLRDRATR